MVLTLSMVVLTTMANRITALPTIQKLPSPERPFVYIHVVGSAILLYSLSYVLCIYSCTFGSLRCCKLL